MSAEKTKLADPLQVAANVYTLIMENEHVRVLDARFRPGARAVMHSHPNHVIYALTDGSFKITTPDGKSVNVDLKAGQAIWMQAGQHDVGNTGKAEAHNLAIELKK